MIFLYDIYFPHSSQYPPTTKLLFPQILVQWDGLQMVNIQLPHDFPWDRTCGLCGKYNMNPDDDFYMRSGPTDYTENANEFGNSW